MAYPYGGINAIALGTSAGLTNQSTSAIALGYNAGVTNQGQSAIAIGAYAGQINQPTNSIVINASGSILSGGTANSLFIAPIRNTPGSTLMTYNSLTNEVVYSNTVGGTITATGLNYSTLIGSSITTSNLQVNSTLTTSTISFTSLQGSSVNTSNLDVNSTLTASTINFTLLQGASATTSSLRVNSTLTASTVNFTSLQGASATTSSLQVNSTLTASTVNFTSLQGSTIATSSLQVNSTLTASTINFTSLQGASATTSSLQVNSTLTASTVNFTSLQGSTIATSSLQVNSTLTASTVNFTSLQGASATTSSLQVNSTLTASTINFTSLQGASATTSSLQVNSTLNASTITFSTMAGSTLFTTAFTASTITASTLNVPGFSLTSFSTLTGSSIVTSTLQASTLYYSTMAGSTLFTNIFTASTITASTLNVPGFSLTSFSTLAGSTLTASTITVSTLNYSTMAGSTIYATSMSVSTLTYSTINGSGGGGVSAGQVAMLSQTPLATTSITQNISSLVTWNSPDASQSTTTLTGLTPITSGGLNGSFSNTSGATVYVLIEYVLYLATAGTNFTYIGLFANGTPTSITAYGATYPSSNWLKNSFTMAIPNGYSIGIYYQDSTNTAIQTANSRIAISNIGTSGATGATGPVGTVGMASYYIGTGNTGGSTGTTGTNNSPTVINWITSYVSQSLGSIVGMTYVNGVFTNNSLSAMPLHIAYTVYLNQTGSGTSYVGINGGNNPQDTYGVQFTTTNIFSNGCTILLGVGQSFAVYHTDSVPFVVQQYTSKINITLLSVGPQGVTGYTGTTGPTGPVGQVTVLSVYPTTTQNIVANTPTTLLWGSTNNTQTLGIMGLTYNAGLFTNNTGVTIPLLLEYTVNLNTTGGGAIYVGINGGTNTFGTMLTNANIFSGSATVLLPAGQTVGLYYTDTNAVIIQTGTPPSQLTQLSISLLTAGPQGSTGYTGTTGPTGPNSWTINGLNLSYTAGMVTASTFTASTIQSGQETTSSIRLTSTVISLGQSTNQNYYNLAQSAVGSTFGSTLTTTGWFSTLTTYTTLANVKNAAMVGAGNYQMVTTGTSTLNSIWLTANNGSTWSTISQATGLPSAVSTIYTYGSMCSLGIYSLLATSFGGVSGGALYLSNNTATSYTNLTPNAIGANPYIYLPFENSIVDVRGNSVITATGSPGYVTGQAGSRALNLANTAGSASPTQYFRGTLPSLLTSFSVTGWFNSQTAGATQIIFSMYSNGVQLYIGADNTVSISVPTGSGTSTIVIAITSAITTNTWYNFVILFQTGYAAVYINNQKVGTTYTAGTGLGTLSSLTYGFGTYDTSLNFAFNGYIDDIRIYNSTIYTGTASTLPSPYALTAAPNAPPLNTSLTAISGNAQYMLASAPSGGLYLSNNFGSTWSQVTGVTANGAWTGLAISYTGQYMVAISQTSNNAPSYSTNYGITWTLTSFTGVTGSFVAISGNGQYCLAGYTTVAFLISNYLAGFSTSTYTQPTLTNINANIAAASLSTTGQYMVIVTAGTTNNVYFSINYGATFTVITVGAAALVSCTMSYDGSYITVANATTVYTLNQNSNGYTVAVGANAGLTNQAVNAIAIGNNAGTINQTANSIILNAQGTALNSYAQGFYVAPIASALASNSATYNVLAYGLDNQVVQSGFSIIYSSTGSQQLQFPDGTLQSTASNFQTVSPLSTINLIQTMPGFSNGWISIAVSYSGQYQIAGAYTNVAYISSNYGQTWTSTNTGTSNNNQSVAISGNGQYQMIFSGSTNVYLSSNYGQAWSSITISATNVSGFAISNTGQYITVVCSTLVYISSNYGQSFALVYTAATANAYVTISSTGQYQTVTGGTPSYIYISSNYGANWAQSSASSQNYYYSAMSATGQYQAATLYSATATTSLYISSNYGSSWSLYTLPSAYWQGVAISGTGQYMIVVSNYGIIYTSSNYGVSFSGNYGNGSSYYRCVGLSYSGQYYSVGVLFGTGNIYSSVLSSYTLGNVGIGTNAPAYPLDVNGIINSSTFRVSTADTYQTVGLTMANTTSSNSLWQLSVSGSSGSSTPGAAGALYIYGNRCTNNGGFAFSIQPTSGNVYIAGALSKGSGTFDIEHPLYSDTNKRLIHSFIEGPRCDLIYRGTTILNNGIATVYIDRQCTYSSADAMDEGTFEALCANPDLFLQNRTGFNKVIGSIQGAILTITCENSTSTDTISWMVVAERKDTFIKEWDRTDSNGYLITQYTKTK